MFDIDIPSKSGESNNLSKNSIKKDEEASYRAS